MLHIIAWWRNTLDTIHYIRQRLKNMRCLLYLGTCRKLTVPLTLGPEKMECGSRQIEAELAACNFRVLSKMDMPLYQSLTWWHSQTISSFRFAFCFFSDISKVAVHEICQYPSLQRILILCQLRSLTCSMAISCFFPLLSLCVVCPLPTHAQNVVSFCLAGLWVPCRREQRQSPPLSRLAVFPSFHLCFLRHSARLCRICLTIFLPVPVLWDGEKKSSTSVCVCAYLEAISLVQTFCNRHIYWNWIRYEAFF